MGRGAVSYKLRDAVDMVRDDAIIDEWLEALIKSDPSLSAAAKMGDRFAERWMSGGWRLADKARGRVANIKHRGLRRGEEILLHAAVEVVQE